MSRIDLGLIDGNYWNAGHVDLVEAAINESSPAGEVIMFVGATAPVGWLLLNGQVVTNAQTLYPDLWAAAPVGWRSGAALNLPNMASRFPMGNAGTLAALGGANAHSIAAGNLPAHSHSIDHDHGPATSDGGTSIPNHVHDVHADGFVPNTVTPLGNNTFIVQDPTGGPHGIDINAGTGATVSTRGIIQTSGNLSGFGHTHQVDLSPFAGSSGNGPGAGTALDTTPAYITFNFLIRCY